MKKSCIISNLVLIFLLLGTGFSLANEYKGELVLNYTKSDITCFGQSNGKIELNVKGGKTPYTIEWENGSNLLSLDNLKKGDYKVTVTDANGKTVVENIKIEMPAPLSILYNSKKETIVDMVNGSMNVEVSGGTPWEVDNCPVYIIQLNGDKKIENPEELEDGIYKIQVKDSRGCEMNIPVNIDFEVSSAKTVTNELELESKNTSYNGYGNVKMTIYKKNKGNVVLLDGVEKKNLK